MQQRCWMSPSPLILPTLCTDVADARFAAFRSSSTRARVKASASARRVASSSAKHRFTPDPDDGSCCTSLSCSCLCRCAPWSFANPARASSVLVSKMTTSCQELFQVRFSLYTQSNASLCDTVFARLAPRCSAVNCSDLCQRQMQFPSVRRRIIQWTLSLSLPSPRFALCLIWMQCNHLTTTSNHTKKPCLLKS